jgi:hypothetical protein
MIRSFRTRLRSFRDDESGLITTEAIIVTPLLVWVFLAMFVYWDAFRAENTSIKATYTIADVISREGTAVNNNFIAGMGSLFDYMANTNEDTWIRVSSIRYVQSNDTFQLLWSRTTNATRSPVHSAGTINAMRARIPRPANADTLLVIETWRNFTPAFRVGLDRRTFYEFTTVRPRFLSPLPIS